MNYPLMPELNREVYRVDLSDGRWKFERGKAKGHHAASTGSVNVKNLLFEAKFREAPQTNQQALCQLCQLY